MIRTYLQKVGIMNSCHGCGALLQNEDAKKEGYTKSLESPFCERCFRIKNYNEYRKLEKDNQEFLPIIREIGSTSHLVLLVVDLFQIPQNLKELTSILKNPILLVLTKRDLLPTSLYEEKLRKYFQDLSEQIVDTVIISTKKNWHFDELMDLIGRYKTSKEVYVIGYTNAGKSSMINRILKDYTKKIPEITTSMLPSTTIRNIRIDLDSNLTLIDTPGILEEGSILSIVDEKTFKKMVPLTRIRPRSYQVKEAQSFVIDSFLKMDCIHENNFVFYLSNQLEVNRKKKKTDFPFPSRKVVVHAKEDIVIKGLGFIKCMKDDEVFLSIDPRVEVYTRKSLI